MMKKYFAMLCSALLLGTAALSFAACGGEPSGVYTVYAPDGAPALALASALSKGDEQFEYRVVAASAVPAVVTGESPAADFCVLPVNAAASKLGSAKEYQLLGTVTNGNMYFLTTGGPSLTRENARDALTGKTVGVVQLANVPGLTLRAALSSLGASVAILGNDTQAATDKVNLKPVQDAATGVVPNGGCDYYLCPEPAASAKIKGTAGKPVSFSLAGSLQELYGESGYPQAVLVGKTSVLKEDKQAAERLISYFAESETFLQTASPEQIVALLEGTYPSGFEPSLNANNLTAEVIAHCSVRFTKAADCKVRIDTFLDELIAVDGQFTSPVSPEFYYEG